MIMTKGTGNSNIGRFGGPGSSHQDRDHPGKNKQFTGRKGGGENAAAEPGSPTTPDRSRVSGGGGEGDLHHTHTQKRS
jgi:hypothetical protein